MNLIGFTISCFQYSYHYNDAANLVIKVMIVLVLVTKYNRR